MVVVGLRLLVTFGDGVTVKCSHCPEILDFVTLTVDRILPGARGGKAVLLGNAAAHHAQASRLLALAHDFPPAGQLNPGTCPAPRCKRGEPPSSSVVEHRSGPRSQGRPERGEHCRIVPRERRGRNVDSARFDTRHLVVVDHPIQRRAQRSLVRAELDVPEWRQDALVRHGREICHARRPACVVGEAPGRCAAAG